MTDTPKVDMGKTAIGAAVTFVTRRKPADAADEAALPASARPRAPRPTMVQRAQDHAASPWAAGTFGAACIAFAVQPINLAFAPSVHIVPLAMPSTGRWALAVFGCLFLPFVPATFAASVAVVAPAVRVVLDLVRSLWPAGKPKE